mmetsp:Transcript_71849/g.191769  ORF Transcript_71849/g.191769 Transcript_71849/m.191769 type:complete len:241 (+) Transcript_71849:305-1027(+)
MSPWQPRGEEQHLFISKNNLQSADSPPLLRGQREEALLCPAAGPLRAGEAGGPHLRVLLRAHTGTGGRPGVGPGLEVGLPRDELAVRRHRPRPLANALVAAGQVRGARGPGVGRVLLEGPREDVVVLPRGSCGGGEADIGPPRLQPHRVLEAQWRVDHRRVHVVDEDTQTAQAVGLYKLQATRTAGVRPMHPHTSSVTICSGWTNRRASLADSHHAHPPRATHTLRERCRLALRRRTWNR